MDCEGKKDVATQQQPSATHASTTYLLLRRCRAFSPSEAAQNEPRISTARQVFVETSTAIDYGSAVVAFHVAGQVGGGGEDGEGDEQQKGSHFVVGGRALVSANKLLRGAKDAQNIMNYRSFDVESYSR